MASTLKAGQEILVHEPKTRAIGVYTIRELDGAHAKVDYVAGVKIFGRKVNVSRKVLKQHLFELR